jgi:formate dehydrogenase major subunit
MTNSYNDIHNSKAIFIIGGNPAEAHPVSLLHVLKAKEQNNAPLIVCDPRFTRTAAHADEYVRFRPGTDVALVWGILWHIFENGWEDKEFIRTRVWGMDQIKAEVAKWTPDEVERVTGTPGSSSSAWRQLMANNRPGTVIWCMGGTQHTNGNNNTRAYCNCSSRSATWACPAAAPTSSAATTTCRARPTLACCPTPCRATTACRGRWEALGRCLGRRLRLAQGPLRQRELRRASGNQVPPMNSTGIPVSRWIDGVLEDKENIDQPDNVRAMVLWGHAPNSRPAARR